MSAAKTARPLVKTAFPAVSIATPVASRESAPPASASRKRTTTKSA